MSLVAVTRTPLALATVGGSSLLAALGWSLSDLWSTPAVAPLCRAAVSLIEQSLASRREEQTNQSHCNCAEAEVLAGVDRALERFAEGRVRNASASEGALRSGLRELIHAGPWTLEVALLIAGWCLLGVRHCVAGALRWLTAPEEPAVPLRAVRRRLR